MSKARYLVFSVSTKLRREQPLAGLYAKSHTEALKVAQEDFPSLKVEVHRFYPPGGAWKDTSRLYWTKESKYGLKYKCKACDKENLGMGEGRYNHWPFCNYHPETWKSL